MSDIPIQATTEPAEINMTSDQYKTYSLKADGLAQLLTLLQKRGYRVIGPTVRDGAVVLDEIQKIDELPLGWQDIQDGGKYQITQKKAKSYFGFSHGPQSWKQFLHSPSLCLLKAKKEAHDFSIENLYEKPGKTAFLGVRACELKAIAIQDKVFLQSGFTDTYYQSHRQNNFVIAVHCSKAGGTCFCASMGTGPEINSGYDLLLTELSKDSSGAFLVRAGSDSGAAVINELSLAEADERQIADGKKLVAKTAGEMGRTLDTTGIKEILYKSFEHPRWQEVGARCLSCGNCTLVCPTCFCTTIEDVTDLTGKEAERWRRWDSCFTIDFSYIHGGSVRTLPGARYRQWLTHKLASWQDQFGTSGCVGCGRCITWCPVGIDITEEARVIREKDPLAAMGILEKE